MDFHAAMETFAEAWVAANTQTAVNSTDPQSPPKSLDDLPTLLPKEQLVESKQSSPIKATSTDKAGPSASSPSGKTLPIHCIVEQASSTIDNIEKPGSTTVELDSYAIIPSSTLFNEMVRTAMSKLGYTSTESVAATGAIQFKNWKPLSFDAITDNPEMTVDDMLGELTSVATLRIRLCSKSPSHAQTDMKEKLLQLLLNQSQDFLLKAGCPIDKELLAQISNGEALKDIPNSTRDSFYLWYQQQLSKSSTSPSSRDTDNHLQLSYPTMAHILSCHTAGLSVSRTRLRTSFDPDHEIPLLNKWFRQNQHPTRFQMMQFLEELNSQDTRRGNLRKQLDLLNIIHWFKNARAAVRKGIKSLDFGNELELSPEKMDNNSNNIRQSTEDKLELNIPELPNKNAVYIIPKPDQRVDDDDDDDDASSDSEDEKSVDDEILEPEDLSLPKPDKNSTQSQNEAEPALSERSSSASSEDSNESQASKRGTSESDETPMKKIKSESPEGCANSPSTGEVKNENGVDADNEDDTDSGSFSEKDYTPPRTSSSSQPASLMVPMYSVPYPVSLYPGLGIHTMPPHFYRSPFASAQHSLGLGPIDMSRYANNPNHTPRPPVSPNDDSDSNENLSKEEKRRRHRVFIDPVSEIPLLEHWFSQETHPPHYVIEKYCDELNKLEYRQRYPKLNPKNVQLWFKNHRAKVKRMRLGQALNLNHNGFGNLNIPPATV